MPSRSRDCGRERTLISSLSAIRHKIYNHCSSLLPFSQWGIGSSSAESRVRCL
jgi:hypothetical protein